MRGFAEAERAWLEDDREEPRYVYCSCCGEELYEGFTAYRNTEDSDEWFCDIACAKQHYGVEVHMVKENVDCDCCHDLIEYGEVVYTCGEDIIHYDIDCIRDYLNIEERIVEV